MVFLVALLFAGGTLIAQVPEIMPWALTPDLSVVAGIMFLGSASYFAYALARPRWTNAGGQLAGFLAYDLVLIVPLRDAVRVGVLRLGHQPLGLHRGHHRQRHRGGVVPAPGAADTDVPGTRRPERRT